MIKIYKGINGSNNFSEDHTFQILESYFSNRYRLKRVSQSIFSLKKLYHFKYNGREMIRKQLASTDTGLIKIYNDKLTLALILDKQLVVTVIAGILMILMLWKAFGVKLFISVLLILFVAILSWIGLIVNGFVFISETLEDIKNIAKYETSLYK
jgi:hypothetical protein